VTARSAGASALRFAYRRTGVRRRARLLYVAIVLVTLLFSYLALSQIDFARAWRALKSSDYVWLIPALAAWGLGNVARAMRWRSLFAIGRRPPLGPVLNATMVGYFYNNILPVRAGEAARVVVLRQRSSASAVEIVGTVLIERVYDLMTVLVIFFAAEPWLPHVGWLKAAAIAAIVLAAAIGVVVIVLARYGERPVHLVLRPLRRVPVLSDARLERAASELAHGLSGLRRGSIALEALAWTLAAWLLSAVCAYFVILAFHLDVPFLCAVLVVVAVGLSMIVPSPPAAIGVFEGAALVALDVYGVSYSAALPYALVLHAVNFIPFVLIGLALLHHNARHPVRAIAPTDAPAPAPS